MTTDKVIVEVAADGGKCKNSIKVLIDGDGTYSAEASKRINRFDAGSLYEFTLYHAIERIAELERQQAAQVITDSSKVLAAALVENERLLAQRDELLTALKSLVEFVSTPGKGSIDITRIEHVIAKAEAQ